MNNSRAFQGGGVMTVTPSAHATGPARPETLARLRSGFGGVSGEAFDAAQEGGVVEV
ncbi:hypothetical protein IQ293_02735, partial [Streptomyces platensis]|nr:hypothetical protein [Streptomyces platensis]